MSDQDACSSAAVVSAVRSNSVARVVKGYYESYGDRFATTVIEDLITSDLSQAVRGLYNSPVPIPPGIQHVLGVDAIIHVASPLAHSASPQVTINVRCLHSWDPTPL